MKCFLKYYFWFFPVRREEGPPEDCGVCWNSGGINMNELLVNNFFSFFFFFPLTNIQMLKDSDTVVCMCLSQHILLMEGSVSLYLK